MKREIEIEKRGLRLRAFGDETMISVTVSCAGGGGGLITVPGALRSKLAESLEGLATELHRWEEGQQQHPSRPAAWEEPETRGGTSDSG